MWNILFSPSSWSSYDNDIDIFSCEPSQKWGISRVASDQKSEKMTALEILTGDLSKYEMNPNLVGKCNFSVFVKLWTTYWCELFGFWVVIFCSLISNFGFPSPEMISLTRKMCPDIFLIMSLGSYESLQILGHFQKTEIKWDRKRCPIVFCGDNSELKLKSSFSHAKKLQRCSQIESMIKKPTDFKPNGFGSILIHVSKKEEVMRWFLDQQIRENWDERKWQQGEIFFGPVWFNSSISEVVRLRCVFTKISLGKRTRPRIQTEKPHEDSGIMAEHHSIWALEHHHENSPLGEESNRREDFINQSENEAKHCLIFLGRELAKMELRWGRS